MIDFCPESLFRLGLLSTHLSGVALRIIKTNHMYLVYKTFQGRNLSNFFGGILENRWFHKYILTFIKHEFAKRSQSGRIAKPNLVRCVFEFWITNHANYQLFLFVFQAFSVFFICIAVTSDMICFLFIPVHWLFFAASTYVWVQYVWHTGKGQSINNVIIFFHRHFNPSLPNRSPLFLCLVWVINFSLVLNSSPSIKNVRRHLSMSPKIKK